MTRVAEPPSSAPPAPVAASWPSGFGLPSVSGFAQAGQRRPQFVLEEPRATANRALPGAEPSGPAPGLLASATYIAGSTALEPGRRYGFRVDDAHLRLLGPLEIEPSVVALDLDLRDTDATSVGARLLVSQPGSRSGSVLAFMSVAGTTPDGLAAAIVEAARAARSA